jgi:hypothetical protein
MRSFLVLVLVALAALPAAGHPLDMSSLDVQVEQDRVLQVLMLRNDAVTELLGPEWKALSQEELLAALFAATLGDSGLSAGGAPCEFVPVLVEPGDGHVQLSAAATCPARGPLKQHLGFLQRFKQEGGSLIVHSIIDGQMHRRVLDAARPGLAFEREGGAEQGLLDFIWLGVEHIFTGYDHLVFLLGLLLAGSSWKRVLLMVTSFTVAHSITLALSSLSVVSLPSRWVESAIALSIIVVAALNLTGRKSDMRWMLAFAFGLLHGFGFASALAELELSRSALVSALFGFNAGVELGQAALVLLALPLLVLLRRSRFAPRVELALCALSIGVGLYWLWERALLPSFSGVA